jgi:GTP-binding protein
MFVDEVEIDVEAGSGGDGCISFRREKYVPRGGPDGGDGGKGGDVIFRSSANVYSLIHLTRRQHWKAQNGVSGSGAQRHGKSGSDLVVEVPPGTMLFDRKHDFLLKDLSHDGDEVVVCRGGNGGKGNTRFKTAINRAPREAESGEAGELRNLRLELKVIADVGLVGKPNAGKSTLLSSMSAAKPEIASYPFTTKHPHLGLVQIDLDRSFVMADIPGLIEGASQGIGLGHDFLRHIQRARILVHLIEPVPDDGSNPLENYLAIRHELIEFDKSLGDRTEIVVITKADLPEAEDVKKTVSKKLGHDVLLISAATGFGIKQLAETIYKNRTTEDSPK